MYVIARKAKTSTGVEYVKQYEPEKTTWSLSKAHIYYTESAAKKICDKMDEDFKVIPIR